VSNDEKLSITQSKDISRHLGSPALFARRILEYLAR